MRLSVIIVSYNVAAYLEHCLRSVEAALEGIEGEIIVADNNSRDHTVERLQRKFPRVNFIALQHNLGFSRANNVALRQSHGDYVLYLNPDTIVGEDVLRHCLDFLDTHPDAGTLGVRMLHSDGTPAPESRRGVPSPMTAFYKMTGLCASHPESRRFGHYYMSYLPWDKAVEIEIVSGAFCMVSRKVLDKVGPFDEDFFMYGEDIDLSYRILKQGFHNWYLPESILHYKGESTQKSSFRYVHVFYEAMLIFFRKHYGHLGLLFSLPIKCAILGKATAALLSMTAKGAMKQLGLLPARLRKRNDSLFVFIGSERMRAECRRIALRHGLTFVEQEGSMESLPEGHLQVEMLRSIGQSSASVYVVYDLSSFRRSAILSFFERQPQANKLLATYDPHTRKLITPDEVYSYEQ